MSQKSVKRFRKVVRQEYANEMQGFWMFPLLKRIRVAWQIIIGHL
jgi:hypothetical protein